jgi:GTPase SAR1 family protein
MKPSPKTLSQYHVFLASPGDVAAERQHVRRFFDEYNRHTAHIWNARFEVVDWENYATIGVGRPQELVTRQTLDKYRVSLALVIGIMAQRFGSPSGKAESGTEEEFNWAMESHKASGAPEIKWFFRKVDKLELPSDPEEADTALDQWKKVRAFRKRMQDLNNPVFYTEYLSSTEFAEVFERDLNQWLADPARCWAAQLSAHIAATGGEAALTLPVEFDAERYRTAVLKRFEKLNFEMLDTTGAFYNAVRLWSVFVPQSVRECHQYNPRLLEIPKEHQRRLLDIGELSAKELEEAEQQADRLRQEYFLQPLRPVLDVVNEALQASPAGAGRKLVMLGDPGSGKSSLIRYLALQWASIAKPTIRDSQPIPLVVELGAYARWQCHGHKDLIRYLEEGPGWHGWQRGLLNRLLEQPGRFVLLLDGLDEVFDVPTRESVTNDIQRFSGQFASVPVILTSRVVGYQAQRLREAEFRHFMLQDLDSVQITDFVDRWHEVTFDDPVQAAPKRDRLQRAVRGSKSIAMLAGNPLLLTMMAILNRNQELPRDRVDLYAQASRVLLHQWDTERALVDFPGMSNEIGLREKTDILRRIAAHMQSGPSGLKGNLLDGTTLTGLIEGYLQSELHFSQSRAVARAVVDQLRQRNFILCFVGADSYAFVHRTFLEYFCAADYVYQFNVAKTLDIDGLIDLFDRHRRDDEWREVLRLICGQIDELFVGRIVRHLTTRIDLKLEWESEAGRLGRPIPEVPLAVDCLGEVRNLARLEAEGRTLARVIVSIYSSGGYPAFLDDLRRSIAEIGCSWPGLPNLLDCSLSVAKSVNPDFYAAVEWPRFVALVGGGRELLLNLASSANAGVRIGALEVLVEKWPDQTTRDLITQRAIEDDAADTRSAALRALAENWPDQTTRDLITQRAVKDAAAGTRRAALQALAEKWPDQTTRDLITQRAVKDDAEEVRNTALQALAEKWPDQTTRDLITQRAVKDDAEEVRNTALQALAEKWPDQTTRDLITKRAAKDGAAGIRSAALQALAEKWPDQSARDLMTQRAVKDDAAGTRRAALQALAEKWPDQTTRDLITQRAVKDDAEDIRDIALHALAAKWQDQTTRDLITQRAAKDDAAGIRSAALQALAEKWPDQSTRDLIAQRALKDDAEGVRSTALRALAKTWPDQTTRDLIAQRAIEAPDMSERGVAFCSLGSMHARFGKILSTRDLDGVGPYLDPFKPIPRQHVELAAAKAGILPTEIDAQVAALSAYLGWDVLVGAKQNKVKMTGRLKKPPRKQRN